MAKVFARLGIVVPSLGAALLPKCPFCVLALASALETLGIAPATYDRALIPLLVILLVGPILGLGIIRRGRTRNLTLLLMGTGAGLYLLARLREWPVGLQVAFGLVYTAGALGPNWIGAKRKNGPLTPYSPACCGSSVEPRR